MNVNLKKTVFVGAFIALSSSALVAQSLADAKKMTKNEQFNRARSVYQQLITAEPANGDNYFYFGENYFKQDQLDSAKILYQKGIDANATNPLNYAGIGKVQWYQNNSNEAKANFFKATTLSQSKNALVLMKIAEAYTQAPTKSLTDALTLLNQAAKLEPKNPEVYILIGDVYLEQNDGSQAIKNYEKATDLNKSSVTAILRIGQLYGRARNYNLALENYKKANDIDSTYAPAYREKAELLFKAGQVDKAIQQYKKYLALNDDLSARARYAQFLFVGKNYQESIDQIRSIQTLDTSIVNLFRIMGYASYETGDYTSALVNLQKFFDKAKNGAARILPSDYEYLGKSLSKSGNDSLALETLVKAVSMDTANKDLYSEIGSIYLKTKQYPEAVAFFEQKISSGKATPTDYFNLGRSFYLLKDFAKADSAFSNVVRTAPSYAGGYLWRARSNSQLDPKNEKWLAKPFFEQYIERVKPEEIQKSKNDLVQAYEYLGYYYIVQKDYATSKAYWLKVEELDSTNVKAKKALGEPNIKAATPAEIKTGISGGR